MDYVSRIKAKKSELGMTNEQLSAASGIPMGTLSKLLAGMNDSPKLGNLTALCQTLGLSLDYVVYGKPENTHNCTLSPEEISLVESYRALDARGRNALDALMRSETEFIRQPLEPQPAPAAERRAVKLRTPASITRPIPLYDLPVSAGIGEYLDGDAAESVSITVSEATAGADFALRISGNSMEPKYHDGDVLLVQNAEGVEVGESGIFVLDGAGYFKVYGGDCLISLNPEYGRIMLKDFENVSCIGKVLGRLRRR